MRKDLKAVTISIPTDWHKKLRRLALEKSLKEDKTITVSSLVKMALTKKFGFKEPKD
jgi:hypothetical protein